MEKHKKRTEKPGRFTIESEESQEVAFEQFERTMLKIVRSEPLKEKAPKDKRKSR